MYLIQGSVHDMMAFSIEPAHDHVRLHGDVLRPAFLYGMTTRAPLTVTLEPGCLHVSWLVPSLRMASSQASQKLDSYGHRASMLFAT